jgi:hypothetical protein
MNLSLVSLIIGVPLFIFVISNAVRYPNELSGEDKKLAMDAYKSDIGLDFFFIGLSIIISTTIALHGVEIPQMDLIAITLYGLLSAVIARTYTKSWSESKVNLCMLLGLIFGSIPVIYSIGICVFCL